MRICVDTAILIEILKDEFRRYQEMLYDALRKGEDLVARVVVYAELIPQFQGDARPLQQFLREHTVDVQPLDVDAVTAAANAWVKYLRGRPGRAARDAAMTWGGGSGSFRISTSAGSLWPSVTPS